MNERISQTIMDQVCRRLCRRVAATLVRAMADTDTPLEVIDERLGCDFGTAKVRLDRLIEGKSMSLDVVSDFAFAMGCELTFDSEPYIPMSNHETQEEAQAA